MVFGWDWCYFKVITFFINILNNWHTQVSHSSVLIDSTIYLSFFLFDWKGKGYLKFILFFFASIILGLKCRASFRNERIESIFIHPTYHIFGTCNEFAFLQSFWFNFNSLYIINAFWKVFFKNLIWDEYLFLNINSQSKLNTLFLFKV